MRLFRLLPAVVVALALAFTVGPQNLRAQEGRAGARGPAGPPFTMMVAGLTDGGDFPIKNSAAGDMTSPEISWENAPKGTVTFLIHMHDMDNARNHTTEDQLHWMVWNIPGTATGLPADVPKGNPLSDGAFQISASGIGIYRPPGYGGNGPKHHYVVELFALDTKLDVQPGTEPFETRAEVLKAAQGHILAKAVAMGLFRRPR